VRALRFHPRPIVVAGITAVAGWSLIVCGAVLTDGIARVTDDYRTYLSSFHIPPAPVSGLQGALVMVLPSALQRAQFPRAAHVTDYAGAEAAHRNLEDASTPERSKALRALTARS
jgi:hypothetical protein